MPTVTHQQAFEIALQHHREGRIREAEAIYRQLLAVTPQNPDLWQLLGVVADQSGRMDEALELIQRAIAANPGAFAYHNNFGLLLTKLGRREEAVAAFANAIRLQPDVAEAHYNLGITLCEMGRADEAVEAYRTALRLQPKHVTARLNLGLALTLSGRTDDAVAHYREVLKEEPSNASVAVNLGNLLKDLARLDEAAVLYRTALSYTPDDFNAHNNLGVALKDCGEIDAALECFRRAVALNPGRAEIRSNLIFTSLFHPTIPPAEIADEMRRWNAIHASPFRGEWRPHPNDPSPDRKLRIGYVSPDFRDHVVGRTLLPCFEAHDRSRFEFFCYCGASVADKITNRYRELSDGWCETANLPEEKLTAQIRRDQIDILVDLTLHTAFNRLLTFARKPAPVQIAWLGYPGATGLEAMDYRITDSFLDPQGQDTAGAFEESIRMPDAWSCFQEPEDSPAVAPLPAQSHGFVTFGSFNNFAKHTERVIALWSRVLRAVEGSRLKLISRGSSQEKSTALFARHGIGAERIEFIQYYAAQNMEAEGRHPLEYLKRYGQIDIALDPFPYNGMTTTCDALWMGVPVVALIGGIPISRASFSLLSNVGLPELAAPSEDDYVRIAAGLARDIPRLTELRATLRERMKASPLLDAARFTRNLEAEYRRVWGLWCARQRGNPSAAIASR